MSNWNDCCDRNRGSNFENNVITKLSDIEAQIQAQRQKQRQFQAQDQDQDQDQDLRQVFRDIGNVRVDIDNQSISVLVLVLIGLFTGALDNTAVRSALDSLIAKKA